MNFQVLSPETRDRIVCMPGWDRLHDLCLVRKLSVNNAVLFSVKLPDVTPVPISGRSGC